MRFIPWGDSGTFTRPRANKIESFHTRLTIYYLSGKVRKEFRYGAIKRTHCVSATSYLYLLAFGNCWDPFFILVPWRFYLPERRET